MAKIVRLKSTTWFFELPRTWGVLPLAALGSLVWLGARARESSLLPQSPAARQCQALFNANTLAADVRQIHQRLAGLGIGSDHRLVLNAAALASVDHVIEPVIGAEMPGPRVFLARPTSDRRHGDAVDTGLPHLLLAPEAHGPLTVDMVISPERLVGTHESVLERQLLLIRRRLRVGRLDDFQPNPEITVRAFLSVALASDEMEGLRGLMGSANAKLEARSLERLLEQLFVREAWTEARRSDSGMAVESETNIEPIYAGLHPSEERAVVVLMFRLRGLQNSSTWHAHTVFFRHFVSLLRQRRPDLLPTEPGHTGMDQGGLRVKAGAQDFDLLTSLGPFTVLTGQEDFL